MTKQIINDREYDSSYIEDRKNEFIRIALGEGVKDLIGIVDTLAHWLDLHEYGVLVDIDDKFHIYDNQEDEVVGENVEFKDVLEHTYDIIREKHDNNYSDYVSDHMFDFIMEIEKDMRLLKNEVENIQNYKQFKKFRGGN